MLPDWFESLLTSCPRHLRQMGYLRELFGIRRCVTKWGEIWEPHHARTRSVICAAMFQCAAHRKAVILGSGWLNDVPVAELADTFREVKLVDAVHPFSVCRKVRRWPNVQLVDADITGVAEAVYRNAHKPGPLPRHAPDLFSADQEVDLVASVNLLSQLPFWPEQFLLRAGKRTDAEIAAYAQEIVPRTSITCAACRASSRLIADVEELTVSVAGHVEKKVHNDLWRPSYPGKARRGRGYWCQAGRRLRISPFIESS